MIIVILLATGLNMLPVKSVVRAVVVVMLCAAVPVLSSAQCITVLLNGVCNPPASTTSPVHARQVVNQHGCTAGGFNVIDVQFDGITAISSSPNTIIINRPTQIKGHHNGARNRLCTVYPFAARPVTVNAPAIVEDIDIAQSSGYHPSLNRAIQINSVGGLVINDHFHRPKML